MDLDSLPGNFHLSRSRHMTAGASNTGFADATDQMVRRREMQNIPKEIERYHATSDRDPLLGVWPGQALIERAMHGDSGLRAALLAEVTARTSQRLPAGRACAPC